MNTLFVILPTIFTVIGAAIFVNAEITYPLWLLSILIFLGVWKKRNYITARAIIYLYLLLITLCGNTNFLMYYAPLDFAIVFTIILVERHKIPRKYSLSMPWVVLLFTGALSGLLFSVDKGSFHIGIEVYFLLLLILLSTELLQKIQTMDFSYVIKILLAVNSGILTLFWGSNTIAELTVKSRALIYLLGDRGIRSNTLAGIIVTFLCIIFVLKNNFRNFFNKIVVYAIIIFDIIILIFLQSRGAYIAVATVVLVSQIENQTIKKSYNRRQIVKTIVVFLVLIMLLTLPNTQSIFENYVLERFVSNTADISNGRFELYREAIQMWGRHIFIGNGFLQFEAFHIAYADPHNWILGYLASTGIIGTIALIIFMVKVVKRNKTVGTLSRAFRYGVLAEIIHGLFEPVLTQNLPLSVFVVICILAHLSKKTELCCENFTTYAKI